ncbi:MAG TPA: hypothetical protein VGK25_00275, partial [Ignavibacteria bacterium]
MSESGENFNMNHLTTGRIKPKFGLNLKYQLLGTLLIIGLAVYFIISTITFINKCELVKAKITDVKFEKGYGDDNDKYTLSIFIPSKNSSI